MCDRREPCIIVPMSSQDFPPFEWDGEAIGRKAASQPGTGRVWVDRKFWATLPPIGKLTIYLHEVGHLEGARCEQCADRRAGQWLKALKVDHPSQGIQTMLERLENRDSKKSSSDVKRGFEGSTSITEAGSTGLVVLPVVIPFRVGVSYLDRLDQARSNLDAKRIAGADVATPIGGCFGCEGSPIGGLRQAVTPGQAMARAMQQTAMQQWTNFNGVNIDSDDIDLTDCASFLPGVKPEFPIRSSLLETTAKADRFTEIGNPERTALILARKFDESTPLLQFARRALAADDDSTLADDMVSRWEALGGHSSWTGERYDTTFAQDIVAAARKFWPQGVTMFAWLLAGVGSRESNLGDPWEGWSGTGDNGNSLGEFQINRSAHPEMANRLLDDGSPAWKNRAENTMMGAEILAECLRAFGANVLAALAAYNRGIGQIRNELSLGHNPDDVTAGGNYGKDVIARIRNHGGSYALPVFLGGTEGGSNQPGGDSNTTTQQRFDSSSPTTNNQGLAVLAILVVLVILLGTASSQSRRRSMMGA